jgi:lysozyme
MKMSETGLKLLAQWEGTELMVYKDVAGLPTIGVGHLLTQDELSSGKIIIQDSAVRYADGLNKEQVMQLLAQDIEEVEKFVNDQVEVDLKTHQFDTLVSFTFNVGRFAFKNSTLLKLLNQGNYDEIPYQLARWVYSGGRKIRGLINRRKNEIDLWNS